MENNKIIIIPKEEPKQGTISEAIKQVIDNQLKQETIEQAIDRIYPLHKGQTCIAKNKKFLKRTAFEKGVKWEKEQSKLELSELLEQRNEMLAMLENYDHYTNKEREQLIKKVKDNG